MVTPSGTHVTSPAGASAAGVAGLGCSGTRTCSCTCPLQRWLQLCMAGATLPTLLSLVVALASMPTAMAEAVTQRATAARGVRHRDSMFVTLPMHTVSGLSSGGDMAVNHFVAFSRSTTGAAIVAGAPYGCNLVEKDDTDWCGAGQPSVPWRVLLDRLAVYIRRRAVAGLIDPPSALRGRRVYLFSGLADRVVRHSVMKALRSQLEGLVGPRSVVADFDVWAAHGWVVDGSTCGPDGSYCNPCCCSPGPLLACPGHDVAGLALRQLYPGALHQSRAGTGAARWLSVPQAEYLPPGHTLDGTGLWKLAYLYVPLQCFGPRHSEPRRLPTGCGVHVHYHGCGWGAQDTGFDVLGRLGLLEWADPLRLVLVFPQASHSVDVAGCWDWTGETGPLFDTKLGPQLNMVVSLVADLPRLLGQGADSLPGRATVNATDFPAHPGNSVNSTHEGVSALLI
mmetsp:Transcript_72701/g.168460  ORF Transcript_72701/g.168460 Transcript_72701/m.168460 type:complete len:452 (-) Transcript_72701:108-1463(-)